MFKCFIMMGDLQSARDELDKALKLDRESQSINDVNSKSIKILESLDNQARNFMKEADFKSAITKLDKLLDHAPCSFNHILLKIDCLLKLYQTQKALQYTTDLMKREWLQDARINYWHGRVLIYNGQIDKGIQ